MDASILDQLQAITPEERRILAGNRTVERELYTTAREFVVESGKMLAKGQLIDMRKHTRFVEFPRHKHDFIEISYMCKGRTTHIIDGETALELEEGDLLFLNQHVFHQILPAGEEDILLNFIILPQFFDVALDMMKDGRNILSDFISSSLRNQPGAHDVLHFRVKNVLPVRNLVENLVYSMLHPSTDSPEIDKATMGVLLLQLLNCTDRVAPVEKAAPADFLAASALRYIGENYRTATLTELAGQLKQSVSSLSKAVKRGTGSTFSELLLQKRLARAGQLLRHTALTVTEIVAAVGYENTSYFHREFRNFYGVSPRQYRRESGEEEVGKSGL